VGGGGRSRTDPACAPNLGVLEGLRAAHPLAVWDDATHGRLAAPPSTWRHR
jgi:hypothetical protein